MKTAAAVVSERRQTGDDAMQPFRVQQTDLGRSNLPDLIEHGTVFCFLRCPVIRHRCPYWKTVVDFPTLASGLPSFARVLNLFHRIS
jgi:hypothetical protein